jgi:hypothetical protein
LTQKKSHRKIWLILAAIGLFLLFLGTGVRYVLKSDWLFDKIRDIATEQAGSMLHGTLSIETIRGDLLNGFVIKNLNLKDDKNEVIAGVDSISVSYRLISLLRTPHNIEEIKVSGAKLWITQEQDSTWNFMNLAGELAPAEEPADQLYWAIGKMTLSEINVYIRSEYMLPDGFLDISDLNATLTGGNNESGFFGSVNALEFSLREARLPEPVAFFMSAEGSGENFTLESLVLNTGRSILTSKGSFQHPDIFEQTLEFTPLSWKDLLLYAEEIPLQEDLNISISAGGTFDDLNVGLQLTATGAENLEISAGLSRSDHFSLKKLHVTVNNLNLPVLTGMDHWPVFKAIHFEGEGDIPFGDPLIATFDGEFMAEEIHFQPYKLERINSSYTIRDGNAGLDLILRHRQEEIFADASLNNLFGDRPVWNANVRSENLNLATWLNDETLDSNLNLRFSIDGMGIHTDDFSANIMAGIAGTRFGNQPFSEIRLLGTLDPENISGLLTGRLEDSEFRTEFDAANWTDEPEYNFEMQLSAFNTAELEGLEFFPTYLNGSLKGEGRSFDIESMYLMAELSFDSSIVNREKIDTFRTSLKIEKSSLFLDEGLLQSPIADATFSLQQHLTDFLNPENRMQFAAEVKDLYPLRPLFDVGELDAQGEINGKLARNNEGILQFDGGFSLENIRVDTLFRSQRLDGSVQALLKDEPEYFAAIELYEPAVLNTAVQDVQINAEAIFRENDTTGKVNLTLTNGDESSIYHDGDFFMDSTRFALNTTDLTFRSRVKSLALMEPFSLTYSDEILRMDTLAISSGDNDAYLKLWIPHLDTLRQEVGVDVRNLNLGELQQAIFEEMMFDGILSGVIDIARSPDNLEISASGQLNDFRYKQGIMDSLRFDADVTDEWLSAEMNAWHRENILFEGHVRVPFLTGDLITFDEQYFEREVSGNIQLHQSALEYWFGFTPEGAPEQTVGNISMDVELNGIAGSPQLKGKLSITEGQFSGINIDRIGMEIDYSHDAGMVDVNGNIVKDQKPILGFDAAVPFIVDLRLAEILLPSDGDSVYVNFRTDEFDLALLNSYVDPELLRNIAGRLEGNVTLSGTMSNFETSGEMQLTRGSVRVVPAGITLAETGADVLFEPGRITVRDFVTRSGPGRLRGTGSVDISSLEPGDILFEITANQFRAMNTTEYNFLINTRSQLDGTLSEPRIRGTLTFLTGLVNLQNFGDRALETVVLEEEKEQDPVEFYEALAMEMNIDFGRQFLVRSRQYIDMEFYLTGSVDLLKQKNEELQMFGTLEGIRGFARPLGRNFDLDEAVVAFYGPVDDPQLNIRTRYEPPQADGVRIYYIIDGTMQDPDFSFDSEPELELQDIVSYTLFGKPFYDLDSWEQVLASSGSSPTAADIALDVLLDRVEMLASQRLGIDVVQIDNTRSGSRNTTSIKTGWFLNQRTFFAILNEIGGASPRTLFMLEYLLMDNLELIITQGDDSREGIDLRWKLDY